MIVPQARSDIVPRPKTYPFSRQQSQLRQRHWPHPLTPTGRLVILRDRAGLHHRQPYVLPAECSPRRRCALSFYCAVRLGTCRKISCRRQWWLGMALIRDIPRSASIAVQRLDELFSGPALQTHAKRCKRTYEGEVCVQRTWFSVL